MLDKKVHFYYRQILSYYPNSYFAEDLNKVIIGIDCEYLDANSMSFSEFKSQFYAHAAKKPLCDFAGFFGVFSADFVRFFEELPFCKEQSYDFPQFFFANARAYLIYEKNSKMFFKFGPTSYFEILERDFTPPAEPKASFEILSDLKHEEEDFLQMIDRAKDYLLSGDIFQVVLSKQLCIKHNVHPFSFYEALSEENPSAYMFYFPTPYGVVLGSSPELILSVKNKEIFVAPIAGTRNLDAKSDLAQLEEELLSDEKELCEHRMLVDLARNDLSKFGDKVRVEKLFSVLKSKYVMHIVSEVYANMKEVASIFDVIGAVFPAGTLSGAPKIRALQIIAELEKKNRGIYGGGVGFLNFNENVMLAILIRSAFFKDDKAFIASGAGIVLKSEPQKEYAEICAKRRALLASFERLAK